MIIPSRIPEIPLHYANSTTIDILGDFVGLPSRRFDDCTLRCWMDLPTLQSQAVGKRGSNRYLLGSIWYIGW